MIHHTQHRFCAPFLLFRSSLQALPLGACLLGTVALGCTRSEVSLGSGQQAIAAEAQESCGDGIIVGNVSTDSQAELEALRGCSEITGDLELLGFPGMDLTPLSELRIIRGNLYVGSQESLIGSPFGTIASLEGLEGLEQVNGLHLAHVTASDLSGLRNLRRVNFDPLGPHSTGGRLSILNCDVLRDLSGLDSLVDFAELSTIANDQLASLSGLRVPGTLRLVEFGAEPSLKDLSALAPLREVDTLHVQETQIESLAGLQLERAGVVFLHDNDSLLDVDSLSSLLELRELIAAHNDRLQQLPSLDGVNGLKIITVVGNGELRSVPTFQNSGTDGLILGAQSRAENRELLSIVSFGFDLFEVGDNPKLTRIAGIGSFPEGRHVAIYGNASLTDVDLGALNELSSLHIVDNASLESVRLVQPARIADLDVRNNPRLSTAALAAVQSFSSQISGNLDQP